MSTVLNAIENKNGDEKKKTSNSSSSLSKETTKNEFIQSATAKKPTPAPRGRPPKKTKEPLPSRSANEVIDVATRKRYIKRLNALRYHFPEEMGQLLQGFNPGNCTNEQLDGVIDSCEEYLSDSVEQKVYPSSINKLLSYIETGMIYFAVTNRNASLSKYAGNVMGLTETIENDPNIQRDIKIISARNAGTLPNSPYARIVASIVNCAAETIQNNMYRNIGGNKPINEDDPMNSDL